MPYIKDEDRVHYNGLLKEFEHSYVTNPGDLNYLITKLCDGYAINKGENYITLNEIIGVLECAKLEFYRRIITPYENEKISENGDVYES